ncbi:MAG: phasin family protein [Hyphomicrobiales bacterium]|nr:phasin family protein [Hyphomicrobiales bacterium]
MAEAGHETTRRAAGHAAQTARTMSDAAERTARTGADVFQRNSEQFRQTVEMGSDAATRIAERAFGQFARAFGVTGNGAQQTTQQSARNVEAILHSSAIIADGVQTIAREWLSFAQNRAERNMERFEALSNSRSVQDFVATHTDLVRDHLQDLLQTTKRVAEVSTRMVDEAVQTGDSTLAPR